EAAAVQVDATLLEHAAHLAFAGEEWVRAAAHGVENVVRRERRTLRIRLERVDWNLELEREQGITREGLGIGAAEQQGGHLLRSRECCVPVHTARDVGRKRALRVTAFGMFRQ